jgi:hypothetical protein
MLRTKMFTVSEVELKTHQQGKNYHAQHHFFILNKGLNSGMPLRHHCPNCFVFLADDKEEREFYFFIFQGLWNLKLFRKYLLGSVIEYIHKDDIADLVEETVNSVNSSNRQFADVEDTLFQIEMAKESIQLQLNSLMELRKTIFHKYLIVK